MAKSDFVCKGCSQVKGKGLLGVKKKYECPKCGILCKDCVNTHLIASSKCKKCNAKVLEFRWEDEKWKQV